LSTPEQDWILEHTADCRYCANELDRYERIDDTLDRLPPPWSAEPPPLPPPVLRHPRAGYARIDSPVGPLFLAATEAGICEIDFASGETEDAFRRRLASRGFAPYPLAAEADAGGADRAVIERAARQLREYFGGRRHRFDLPLDFSGVSPFTRRVLEATAEVPFGRLDTYRAIASRVGKPSATRAVGNALGRNPIPVIVPCHRIIRSDSSLGGYTGGLHIKQRLLAIEGVALP
jgi:methylated-DNA-[protein]-cysteine S-methyltransferase